MDSNIKAVTKPQERLQAVIQELDIVAEDFLEKGEFVLMELMETSTIHVDDTPDDRTHNLNRANRLADIAYDYLSQAQSALIDLVLRERREGGQVNG